jgi:hypothetical protein
VRRRRSVPAAVPPAPASSRPGQAKGRCGEFLGGIGSRLGWVLVPAAGRTGASAVALYWQPVAKQGEAVALVCTR